MNRRGIALLATLWVLTTLSVLAAGALLAAREARGEALARIALVRGRWAAEACLAILQGAVARGADPVGLDSTDLGAGLWCRATVEDPTARIKLDVAQASLLDAAIADPVPAASLLDWIDPDDTPRAEGAEAEWYRERGLPVPKNGPLADIAELLEVRGFDSATVARLRSLVTTEGSGHININAASVEVLRLLPGLEAGAALMVARRDAGRPARDLDDLLGGLPRSLRSEAASHYADLQGLVSFAPDRLILHLEGHVAESPLVARTTVEAALPGHRLAILTREEW